MELGSLLLRVVIGALFVGHGLQKLAGWFDGPGIDGTSAMFGSLGYPQPRRMAMIGSGAESLAGALLVLGLLTPFAAAAIVGVMVNAISSVHRPNGLWVSEGGYEYNLVLIAGAATLAFTGPGLWSLDGAIGWNLAGPGWGMIALLLGLVVGTVVLSLRQPEEAATEEAAEPARDERRAA